MKHKGGNEGFVYFNDLLLGSVKASFGNYVLDNSKMNELKI